jgi:hypothetical protein
MKLRPSDANVLYNSACTYGILQRKKETLGTLKKAIASGFRLYEWAERDPDLSCVHDDPEFKRLMAEIRRKGSKVRKTKS